MRRRLWQYLLRLQTGAGMIDRLRNWLAEREQRKVVKYGWCPDGPNHRCVDDYGHYPYGGDYIIRSCSRCGVRC